MEQHFCYAKVVACGRVIEREWGNPSKVPPSHSPFLAMCGSADNKTCGQLQKKRHLWVSLFLEQGTAILLCKIGRLAKCGREGYNLLQSTPYGKGGIFVSQVTKRALESSLKKLLLEKPLHKITVSDITDDCGINRMTFYYHFKDIYDLVEWCCQEDASRALAGKKTYETWQQGLLQIFEAVQENKPFILNVYRSVSREQVESYLYQVTYRLLEDVVEEQARGMSVRPEDKAFIATLYKYMFVGLMLDWVKNDMKGDPQVIVDRLEQVIHGSVKSALERLRTDKPLSNAAE